MSRDKKDLHPSLVEAFEKAEKAFIAKHPLLGRPILTCTYRSNAEQERLYAQGRGGNAGKVVTHARAGQSPHNFLPALAFDIAFVKGDGSLDWDTKLFAMFAEIIKQLAPQVEWGGDWKFKDAPHFELKAWKSLKK